MGINFGTIAAVFASCSSPNYQGHFSCVRYFETDDNGVPREFPVRNERLRTKSANDFGRIPSRPIAYWLSKRMVDIFASSKSIKDLFSVNPGMRTGKDELFLRLWFEVSNHDIQFGLTDATEMSPEIRWFPLNKGGVFRKWYGNSEHVVNLYNDAIDIKTKSPDFRLRDKCWYFKPYVTWSRVTSSDVAFRLITNGVLFSDAGPGIFAESRCVEVAKLLNSKLGNHFLAAINPTLNYQKQDIESVPFIAIERDLSDDELVVIARHDWDNFETSWDFRDQPLLRPGLKGATLEASWRNWEAQSTAAIHRMQELETQNNRIWIEAYALQGELSPEVPDNEITLARPSRRKDMAAFLSYAVGCMMGRYSLDKPGLILVNVGDSLAEYLAKVGQPFDTLKFAPDEDGIIPVLDGEWFEDDIAVRTQNFLRATFGGATLEANLHFIEESLGKDLRKYFLTDFYKDHLQTYKKRPIYWLFSSGKERAFQCLVYLHRYQDGTLARMRTEYVIPLQGKMAARIEQLASETQKAPSTSQRKTLEKERDKLLKHQTELRAFDEKLRHYADQRITLDLDDGVKVNYGKFGDLLAEVKAVAGGTDED